MLYPKNKAKDLTDELFKNPTAEYRATPFWAWNSNLDKSELFRQIQTFKKMGFGGFHMHVRQGLTEKYLGEEFLSAVKFYKGFLLKQPTKKRPSIQPYTTLILY